MKFSTTARIFRPRWASTRAAISAGVATPSLPLFWFSVLLESRKRRTARYGAYQARITLAGQLIMRFRKATGLTPSEELLAKLCDRSFLSLWSYPNLFRKVGKELIDLLVVFGDDVILFSDKSCAYPDSGNTTLDWTRWYRRSITESVRQIRQAEDWIRRQPERVFLDAKATERLPIALPSSERLRIHRVCIALGASKRAETETGRKTLSIAPSTTDGETSFAIGRVSAANGWVHVFDDETLSAVLSELSTTPDFLDYLRKKEALFDGGRFAGAESELDLLAYFLWKGREFPVPDAEQFRLDPNLWPQVVADPQFLAAWEENKIGQFWDGLIEYLNDLYMKEQLEHGNTLSVAEHERVVRVMAGETRFYRRILSKWILERAERAKEGYVGSLCESEQSSVLYVLLIGPGDGGKSHKVYRQERVEQLYARCIAGKAVHPNRRIIVGIALDARGVKGSSEDFIYMDTDGWSEERIVAAEKLRQELGFYIEGVAERGRINEAEYPS